MLEIIKNRPIVLFLTRWTTIIIWCSYILPITALIIYVGYAKNLDKCDVDFNSWMLVFILTTFTFITIILIERSNEDTRFVTKTGIVSFLILWIIACILFSTLIRQVYAKMSLSKYITSFSMSSSHQ